MSEMRLTVYRVDAKTLKRLPVERETVVRSDDSVPRTTRDILRFELCQCSRCST
jgi:hypothetical protein